MVRCACTASRMCIHEQGNQQHLSDSQPSKGRVYVGKSKNVAMRSDSHRDALERGIHINSELHGEWETYGADAFEFIVLEEVRGSEALSAAEARHRQAASNPYNTAPVREPCLAPDTTGPQRYISTVRLLACEIHYRSGMMCDCGRIYVSGTLVSTTIVRSSAPERMQGADRPSDIGYVMEKGMHQWRANALATVATVRALFRCAVMGAGIRVSHCPMGAVNPSSARRTLKSPGR